jgi:hypothetical protein
LKTWSVYYQRLILSIYVGIGGLKMQLGASCIF